MGIMAAACMIIAGASLGGVILIGMIFKVLLKDEDRTQHEANNRLWEYLMETGDPIDLTGQLVFVDLETGYYTLHSGDVEYRLKFDELAKLPQGFEFGEPFNHTVKVTVIPFDQKMSDLYMTSDKTCMVLGMEVVSS